MLHALTLGSESAAPVEPIHRPVERPVRPAQVRRHQVGIVEIGERRSPMGGASVEHGLSQRFQPR